MDIRIWKPLYEAYFCSNMLPASAPSFFRAHLGAKILSSTKNRMDVLTELRDRREAERGTQDTTEKGTEGDASSLFLSEMLRQKVSSKKKISSITERKYTGETASAIIFIFDPIFSNVQERNQHVERNVSNCKN